MDDLELLLPELLMNTPDLSVAQIRLQGTLQQRLPSIPGAGVEALKGPGRLCSILPGTGTVRESKASSTLP